MPFGKEFASQVVPEWQEDYMDYKYVENLLKEIRHFQSKGKMLEPFTDRKLASGSAVVGVEVDIEEQITPAVMSPMQQQSEHVFFKTLDDEFNKVNQFYKDKVEEAMEEADILKKQMNALSVYQQKFDNMVVVSSDAYASQVVKTFFMPTTLCPTHTGRETMDVADEKEQNSYDTSDDSSEGLGVNDIILMNTTTFREMEPKYIEEPKKLVTLEILNPASINNARLETQGSFMDSILNINQNKEVSFRKENLKKVEKQLKHALIQFYQKLRHLKSYSFLNLLAFSKIMKKYDKMTSKSASKSYLNMLDNSYLGSSDDVTRIIERMEGEFIKNFSHSKGIDIMGPNRKRERHVTTFSLGFLSGCAVALLLALVLIIHARNILTVEGHTWYMETTFRLYCLFGLSILHMLLYGGNIFFWRRYRVNYAYIFGLKQGTELGYRDIFLVSAVLTTLASAGVLVNLDMEINERTKDYIELTELIPFALVCLVLLVTFCPFNILYRSSRFYILKCAVHTVCAPLYKVTLPDFFFADQLTSQTQALRSLQFYVCYYAWGDFKLRKNTCSNSDVYNTFSIILTIIPFWFRMLQCLRRLFEEKDRSQGYNALKYLSIILSVLIRGAYSKRMTMTWWVLAWISSVIAGVASTYWDIVLDWGLLQRKSKNRWLRDKLLVSQKSVYFGAMVLNLLLRFAWLETVLNFRFQVSFLHREAYIAIVACLEIIRRGSWNFFRLENEHLNNVGHYRAFKSVPLPFNYGGEDEDRN